MVPSVMTGRDRPALMNVMNVIAKLDPSVGHARPRLKPGASNTKPLRGWLRLQGVVECSSRSQHSETIESGAMVDEGYILTTGPTETRNATSAITLNRNPKIPHAHGLRFSRLAAS